MVITQAYFFAVEPKTQGKKTQTQAVFPKTQAVFLKKTQETGNFPKPNCRFKYHTLIN